jgi:hypothetical protein
VSALAHGLESAGLPTSVIALVLPQVEKTRPPRALMVPFMLGRPFGTPDNAAFQRAVILHALGLLERTDGPVILDNYLQEDASSTDLADWACAMVLPNPQPEALETPEQWRRALQAELAVVLPVWQAAVARKARTTVGLSGQPPDAFADFAAQLLDGSSPTIAAHASSALAMRFMADDLKALYGEAVQSHGEPPSARQVDTWFWRSTVAGRLLIALRTMSLTSSDNAIKTVGSRFLVPTPWLPA